MVSVDTVPRVIRRRDVEGLTEHNKLSNKKRNIVAKADVNTEPGRRS